MATAGSTTTTTTATNLPPGQGQPVGTQTSTYATPLITPEAFGLYLGELGKFMGGKQFKDMAPDVGSMIGGGGPQPTISTAKAIPEDLVAQQINAARANIAGQTAGGMEALARQFGARGQEISPALMALQQQMQSRGLGQELQAQRDIAFAAAEKNAQQQLQAQSALAQAVETAYGKRQQEAIERGRVLMTPYQTMLQSLMGGVFNIL